MTNRFNTRLIKFLYISSYGSHTLWCLGDVTTEGAEGNGAGFYSCAQMSFVSPPPHWDGGLGCLAPLGGSPCSAGPGPRTRAVLRVSVTARGCGSPRGSAPPGLCLDGPLPGGAGCLRWTRAISLPLAVVTTLH